VMAIALAGRYKGPGGEERRKKHYRELLRLSRQILNDTQRLIAEVEGQSRQTKARVYEGLTQLPGRIVSFFNLTQRSSAKAKQVSPLNSASWCRYRKQRTRSSRITRCSTSG